MASNKRVHIFIGSVFLALLFISISFALEVSTHETINSMIAGLDVNGFVLDSYLKKQLGFKDGIKGMLGNYRISKWLSLGGTYEDKPDLSIPYRRSVNHFHNPLTEKGYSGFFFGLILSGDSVVQWAQKPLGKQSPGGCYSWYDVRDYYYRALTSVDKNEKEKYFVETFRGLGQLMHLVQDTSVPAHARNDSHLLYNYENWVENNAGLLGKDPILFDPAILSLPVAGLPIANIFDTNKYDGKNPGETAGNRIGLTEYTNVNFFSEDTINSKAFPYPKIDSQTPVVERPYLSVSGEPYIRNYYLKNCCGETNGGEGYLLAAVDYYDYWRERSPSPIDEVGKVPVLDKNVYRDYASLLLPRAVGYSAGLLQYFFRGELRVTAIPIFFQNSLHYMRVKIKNMTPNENMVNGTFALTYRYTPAGGPPDGSADIFGQAEVPGGGYTFPWAELRYEKDELLIDFSIEPPLPKGSYDSLSFMLVFRGTLGKEEGAVVGKFFVPGEVIFGEDWDNGFTGNHNWAHTGFNLQGTNPDNGTTGNTLVGGELIKDNLRFAGEEEARTNESFVSILCCNGEFKDILPIQVTRNTYLMFKIDAMSINQAPPADPGTTTHWQGLWLYFSHGLILQFSQENQMVYWGPKTGYYTFSLGEPVLDNIYDLFKNAEISIPEEPFYLESVDFVQQLWNLEDPSPVEHHQHMEIDLIQFIEGKEQ